MRTKLSAIVMCAIAAPLAGCPTFGPSYIACGKNAECPEGYSCASGFCASDATLDGGATVDAGCTTNSECLSVPGAHACYVPENMCVQCVTATDCGNTGVMECSPHQTCVYNLGNCGSASDCAGLDAMMACDVGTHTCVECVTNADCGSGLVCELSAMLCEPAQQTTTCTSNMGCANLQTIPYCAGNGGGQCVQCNTDGECLSGAQCDAGKCYAPP